MAISRTDYWPNGDIYTAVTIYSCDGCNNEFSEMLPHVNTNEGLNFCIECGFKHGLVTEEEFLENSGFAMHGFHASIKDDQVTVWFGKRAPWEKSSQEIRRSTAYQHWRKAVFERDNYTCQICGRVGGTLNAHHITHFATHPALRLKVSNGMTLCEECHRNIHRKRRFKNGERSISN